MRRRTRWVVVSPFGMFGGRRGDWRYGQGYDSRYGPGYGRGFGRRNSGGGCLRDPLLLEGGCWLARPVCRYTPSCSTYAAEAITRYGAVEGTKQAAGRLLRCRPGTTGGFDPVGTPTPGQIPG